MRLKKQKAEPKPEPKYVVLYEGYRSYSYDTRDIGTFFATLEAAAEFSANTPGSRIFGLTPEYEATKTVTISTKVKEAS